MELAGRVFDVVTNINNTSQEVREELSHLFDKDNLGRYRRVLRMAALLHDIGHSPYSHAAEGLLPGGWKHEDITAQLIDHEDLLPIWESMSVYPAEIKKLALGRNEDKEVPLSSLEDILSQIVVGDALGVDRMDYLLRDSWHIGVAYGRFDHYRLIDTLRILPLRPSDQENRASKQFALGLEVGGIQSAEALLLARYFMFSQVYFHPVRRIYDIHLRDFLKDWLLDGYFSTSSEGHLKMTDIEVLAAMRNAERDKCHAGHIHACRILNRNHFKVVYSRTPKDADINPEAGKKVFEELCDRFGSEFFRHDRYTQQGEAPNFPVLLADGSLDWSLTNSEVLRRLPVVNVDFVFADRSVYGQAVTWLRHNRENVIQPEVEGRDNG
jgi:HD superfamily phosphohydrolase